MSQGPGARRPPVPRPLRSKGPAGLRRALGAAVDETLAKLPEVIAVLGYPLDGTIRVVSILSDRSDEAILRVAEQELALMVKLENFLFDFRTAGLDRMETYLLAGYTPVLEKAEHAESGPTRTTSR